MQPGKRVAAGLPSLSKAGPLRGPGSSLEPGGLLMSLRPGMCFHEPSRNGWGSFWFQARPDAMSLSLAKTLQHSKNPKQRLGSDGSRT